MIFSLLVFLNRDIPFRCQIKEHRCDIPFIYRFIDQISDFSRRNTFWWLERNGRNNRVLFFVQNPKHDKYNDAENCYYYGRIVHPVFARSFVPVAFWCIYEQCRTIIRRQVLNAIFDYILILVVGPCTVHIILALVRSTIPFHTAVRKMLWQVHGN